MIDSTEVLNLLNADDKKKRKSPSASYKYGYSAPLILFGQKEIERLQNKLKQLQGEEHNHGERSFSPRQMAASLKRKSLSEPRYPELQIPENIEQFLMSQIEKATENFHSRNFIGEGGYGPVYKGKLGGTSVAIKLLKPRGRQGFSEYQQEVILMLNC